MKKAVCLWSGGLDSTTLIYKLKSEGYDVYALSFNYGQKHSKELESVRKIASLNNIPTLIVDISNIDVLIKKGSLMTDESVPEGYYTQESQKSTVVPNRNMILLSLAVGYAETIGASIVSYAAHKSDVIYPDCRKEFIEAMSKAIELATEGRVRLYAPFADMTKAEIVKLGLELKVPYELTWSCYKGGERPCLKCGTCLERIEAFKLNNVKDPLLTDEEWEEGLRNLEKFKKEVR